MFGLYPKLFMAFGALAIIAGATMWLYSRGAEIERVNQLERTLEDAETFNEGAGTDADCDWYSRLSGVCANDTD